MDSFTMSRDDWMEMDAEMVLPMRDGTAHDKEVEQKIAEQNRLLEEYDPFDWEGD